MKYKVLMWIDKQPFNPLFRPATKHSLSIGNLIKAIHIKASLENAGYHVWTTVVKSDLDLS